MFQKDVTFLQVGEVGNSLLKNNVDTFSIAINTEK